MNESEGKFVQIMCPACLSHQPAELSEIESGNVSCCQCGAQLNMGCVMVDDDASGARSPF